MELSNHIQNFINFKADGLNAELTVQEKFKISDLYTRLESAKKSLEAAKQTLSDINENIPVKHCKTVNGERFERKLIAVDVDYSLSQQLKIFAHGKFNYKIWFLNKKKKLCVIDDTALVNNVIYLTVTFDVYENKTKSQMSLDRFLFLVEIGEFTIKNSKFIKYYMKPYTESNYITYMKQGAEEAIRKAENNIQEIINDPFYLEMQARYESRKCVLLKNCLMETSGLSRDVAADPAKEQKKKKKTEAKQTELKTLWNSVVTEAERAYFIGWLCSHIHRITIKVVDRGVSDKVLSKAYPDSIYGKKYREKANTSGWDASSGKLFVTDTEGAPMTTIKALSTLKHLRKVNDAETIFNGKAINNLDLCLFILSKYNKYGIVSGVGKLAKVIDYKQLCVEEFPNDSDAFYAGYNNTPF